MEAKNRKEKFEEKLARYNSIKSMIASYKKTDILEAVQLDGEFMVDEMEDLREFLGDKAKGTKLFTIGANNMSKSDLSIERRVIANYIEAVANNNPEFSEEIYEMLSEECYDVYSAFEFERQLDEEAWSQLGSKNITSKFSKDKISYINARKNFREKYEKEIEDLKKQEELKEKPELVDPKSKFRDNGIGRG